MDLQTKKRDGRRYITHDPYTDEKIRRRDQRTMKQFRNNPYGKQYLDPEIDFGSVFEMLGLGPEGASGPSSMFGGGLSSLLNQPSTRGGVLSQALFGRAPIVQRLGA